MVRLTFVWVSRIQQTATHQRSSGAVKVLNVHVQDVAKEFERITKLEIQKVELVPDSTRVVDYLHHMCQTAVQGHASLAALQQATRFRHRPAIGSYCRRVGG